MTLVKGSPAFTLTLTSCVSTRSPEYRSSKTAFPWKSLSEFTVTSLVVKSEKKSVNSTVAETEFINAKNISRQTFFSWVILFVQNIDQFYFLL